MLANSIIFGCGWYIAFALPYSLICWAGKGRVRIGLLIALLPSSFSTFEFISATQPAFQAFRENYFGPYIAYLLINVGVTVIALHIQWRGKLPVPGYNFWTPRRDFEEFFFTMLSILCAPPIFGVFLAFPLAFTLVGIKFWKSRQKTTAAS